MFFKYSMKLSKKQLEEELKMEKMKIDEMEEKIEIYEMEKADSERKLAQSMDKIYDLEQDIDQATEAEQENLLFIYNPKQS